MNSRHKQKRILWYESIGFIMLILLSWADEIFCLPYLLFGGGECHPNWRESAAETVVIIIAFIPLFILTKQLCARLFFWKTSSEYARGAEKYFMKTNGFRWSNTLRRALTRRRRMVYVQHAQRK